MIYLWAKAFHVVAFVTWTAGLIVTPGVALAGPDGLRAARRHLLTVGLAAEILTWISGIYLGVSGGHFRSGWLHTKLLVVVLLSAAHGILLKRLRVAEGGEPLDRRTAVLTPLTIAAVAVIASLVIVRI